MSKSVYTTFNASYVETEVSRLIIFGFFLTWQGIKKKIFQKNARMVF